MEGDLEGLLARVKEFSQKLAGEDQFLVVSHHDADGITSCAITVDALRSIGKSVDFMCIKQLDSVSVADIVGYGDKTVIFTDMGSGQLSLIQEHGLKDYYIIDHHPPEKDYALQVNPHDYGFDGGSDVSGAGMAYLVAKALGREGLAHIAVVGAVGDMQDSGGRLSSINRVIMDEAVADGTLKVRNDMRLFGRQSRPIHLMLAYASDPIIPGLTGNPEACKLLLTSIGVEPKRVDGSFKSYVDLTFEERQELTSILYVRLLDANTPEFSIQRMIGEVYTLLGEEKYSELRDAKEYATLLNACGRHERSELGVRVCLGDRTASLGEARTMLLKHRQMLRSGIDHLSKNGVQSKDRLYFFDAGEEISESIVGIVAGMAYGARIIPPDKPVLAFAVDRDDETKLKVSARANWALVRKGIHLGKAMRECSRMCEGEGGGHDIAAGARIPLTMRDRFLDCVNDLFEKQLAG